MRETFKKKLEDFVASDKRTLVLTGDHGYSLFDKIQKENSEQFVNVGVAEQNMIGMSAGLSSIGFRPFVYGLSAFVPLRVLEQIKIDLAHPNRPVVMIGDGAGLVYSYLGVTHQSFEDIASLRAIPNITILSPADGHEMSICMDFAKDAKGPLYLRLGKADQGCVHKEALVAADLYSFITMHDGYSGHPALLAHGSMVKRALELSESLNQKLAVYSVPMLKPMNEQQLIEIIARHKRLITLEEHSIFGGLGTAVAESASAKSPCQVLRLGVNDEFSKKCGSWEYQLGEHGLDHRQLLRHIQLFIDEKL